MKVETAEEKLCQVAANLELQRLYQDPREVTEEMMYRTPEGVTLIAQTGTSPSTWYTRTSHVAKARMSGHAFNGSSSL